MVQWRIDDQELETASISFLQYARVPSSTLLVGATHLS